MLSSSGNKLIVNLQKILFQLLVFLLPSQLAKHFWPSWSLVWGIRVDYLAPTIYLTDLIIISVLLLWAFELLSQRKKVRNKLKQKRKIYTYFLLAFAVFAVVNVMLSTNREVNILKWLKLFELSLLAIYVSRVKFNYKEWFIKPLVVSVIFFSVIGIIQFTNQRTIGGLMYIFGERSFNSGTPGIALVNISGKNYMRAYSTFGHPNALAGYLSVVLLIFVDSIKRKIYAGKIIYIALAFSILGLILTFSKTVIVVLFILVFLYLIVERKRVNKRRLFGSILFVVIILSLLSPIIYKNVFTSNNLNENISNRVELSLLSGKLLSRSPVVGIGLNNFITNIPKISTAYSVSWLLQPVHNSILLTATGAGLVGLAIFVFAVYKAIINSLKYNEIFAWVLIAIMFTGLLDHYWLTLQQNMIIVFIVLGLAFCNSVSAKGSNN